MIVSFYCNFYKGIYFNGTFDIQHPYQNITKHHLRSEKLTINFYYKTKYDLTSQNLTFKFYKKHYKIPFNVSKFDILNSSEFINVAQRI